MSSASLPQKKPKVGRHGPTCVVLQKGRARCGGIPTPSVVEGVPTQSLFFLHGQGGAFLRSNCRVFFWVFGLRAVACARVNHTRTRSRRRDFVLKRRMSRLFSCFWEAVVRSWCARQKGVVASDVALLLESVWRWSFVIWCQLRPRLTRFVSVSRSVVPKFQYYLIVYYMETCLKPRLAATAFKGIHTHELSHSYTRHPTRCKSSRLLYVTVASTTQHVGRAYKNALWRISRACALAVPLWTTSVPRVQYSRTTMMAFHFRSPS